MIIDYAVSPAGARLRDEEWKKLVEATIEEPHGFAHSPHLEHPRRVADRIVAFARDAIERATPARG